MIKYKQDREWKKLNKNNKILVGILAFIVVCVIGYALFSENITVTGTATADGDFEITPSCSLTLPDDILDDFNRHATQGGYKNEDCTVNGKEITLSTTLLYPSAKKIFYAEIKNTGNINAVYSLNGIIDNLSIKLKLYDKTTDELIEERNVDIFEGDFDHNYAQWTLDKTYIKTKDGVHLHTDDEIINNNKLYKDNKGNYYLQFKPGESLVFVYELFWDDNAVQTDYYGEIITTIDYDIIQQTDDLMIQTDMGDIDLCSNYC